jgi:hypothetical protein
LFVYCMVYLCIYALFLPTYPLKLAVV